MTGRIGASCHRAAITDHRSSRAARTPGHQRRRVQRTSPAGDRGWSGRPGCERRGARALQRAHGRQRSDMRARCGGPQSMARRRAPLRFRGPAGARAAAHGRLTPSRSRRSSSGSTPATSPASRRPCPPAASPAIATIALRCTTSTANAAEARGIVIRGSLPAPPARRAIGAAVHESLSVHIARSASAGCGRCAGPVPGPTPLWRPVSRC